jgi:hypothetical protein
LKELLSDSKRRCNWKVYIGNSNIDDFMRNPVSKRNGKDLKPAEGDTNLDAAFYKVAFKEEDRYV